MSFCSFSPAYGPLSMNTCRVHRTQPSYVTAESPSIFCKMVHLVLLRNTPSANRKIMHLFVEVDAHSHPHACFRVKQYRFLPKSWNGQGVGGLWIHTSIYVSNHMLSWANKKWVQMWRTPYKGIIPTPVLPVRTYPLFTKRLFKSYLGPMSCWRYIED